MLCENTTPKKTAYNAYRNENRRVRRAEDTKMYAVGDAYKVHTECIQAYKRVREEFFFYFFLYCLFFYLLLLASSGIPRRTMNDFLLPVVADSRFFRAFIARPTGRPPPSQPISCPTIIMRSCGRVRNPSVPSASLPGWTIKKTCMHCMHQKTDYARYAKTQLRKRLHTMHTKTRIGVSVGLRG